MLVSTSTSASSLPPDDSDTISVGSVRTINTNRYRSPHNLIPRTLSVRRVAPRRRVARPHARTLVHFSPPPTYFEVCYRALDSGYCFYLTGQSYHLLTGYLLLYLLMRSDCELAPSPTALHTLIVPQLRNLEYTPTLSLLDDYPRIRYQIKS